VRERHYDELALDLLAQGGVRLRQNDRGSSSRPQPLMRRRPSEMILTLPTDENVAKFAAYSAAHDLR
jgi:hypothetical protein